MSAADMFWAAPPISRTITAAAVLLSVPVWMGLINPAMVVFFKDYVFTLRTFPQVWRLVTSFILTGPKFGLLMDPYFLFTYGSSLETASAAFSQPGDFFVYLVFVAAVILVLGGVLLGGMMLLSPLTLALAYTYAQDNPNRQVSYFVVTFAVKWLPYVMLAMTFVMAGPSEAFVQGTGLIAAHTYHFLTQVWPEHGGGRKYIVTPQIVRNWFSRPGMTPTQRGAGTAFNAGGAANQRIPQRPAGSGGGWSSGMAGNNWGARGTGRRLGGE
ncbi:Der1-like family-domain-containing protein [Neohortaea acidophila]|uniref:Derlin n=1 Tax=Neohortaea acidophila TaxID=245834 RepID=A0A6A6PXV5_9PEZI|nr:Der1-like family-domain-containing protein [Neohortaea acidophila]KAF2484564.1 Der1-like family-domain-containing protein [Neohortaea acidophila]